MKIRGFFLSLVAIATLVWFAHDFKKISESSPFGYEYGSVAGPIPVHKELIRLFGFFGILAGPALIIYDFVSWVNNKTT